MSIHQKLMIIQSSLKSPKGQYNNFGKYYYRSCEDILESLKSLLKENNCVLVLSDEIVNSHERYYIKATAKLTDVETADQIENTAFAREEESKKGMDGSQITGTASSYARKYALNGLFCIDDTKDADTDEFQKRTNKEELVQKTINSQQRSELKEFNVNLEDVAKYFKCAVDEISEKQAQQIIDAKRRKKKERAVND